MLVIAHQEKLLLLTMNTSIYTKKP